MPVFEKKAGQLSHNGVLWVERVERAVTVRERLRGLLGRQSLGPGAALLIEQCGSIHTVGMRFTLDVVFLDRSWRVTRKVRKVRPGRWIVWGGWRAVRTLESESGCLELAGLKEGDTLVWSEATATRGEIG
jgi:uncharacterized membrane protein (UPF0127 family)